MLVMFMNLNSLKLNIDKSDIDKLLIHTSFSNSSLFFFYHNVPKQTWKMFLSDGYLRFSYLNVKQNNFANCLILKYLSPCSFAFKNQSCLHVLNKSIKIESSNKLLQAQIISIIFVHPISFFMHVNVMFYPNS